MSTFLTLAAAGSEGVHLPMPPWGFGLLTLVVMLGLLAFVWTFRHTAQTMITGDHVHGGEHGAHHAPGRTTDGHGH